ncbi:MAG: methylthioribulose 1-phosphate dehydratase [Acidobacteriota bacterium]
MNESGVPVPAEIGHALAEIGRRCHARHWAAGTSGNFSQVARRDPLLLAITRTGADKSRLTAADVVMVNADGAVRGGCGEPSDETPLHLAIVQQQHAGAVLHTHSVWATLASERYATDGAVALTGFEMLKGLAGVTSPTHREILPILDNDPDRDSLAGQIISRLAGEPTTHGLLLRSHGLTTWGDSLDAALRHLEVLEFLLEVVGREAR